MTQSIIKQHRVTRNHHPPWPTHKMQHHPASSLSLCLLSASDLLLMSSSLRLLSASLRSNSLRISLSPSSPPQCFLVPPELYLQLVVDSSCTATWYQIDSAHLVWWAMHHIHQWCWLLKANLPMKHVLEIGPERYYSCSFILGSNSLPSYGSSQNHHKHRSPSPEKIHHYLWCSVH